jgi:Ca2+-binding EF-hand superfamily protein
MAGRHRSRGAPWRGIIFCCVTLVLGACGAEPSPARRNSALIYSPNGEPLSGGPLGRPRCEDAMARWFDRVDADHDGTIDRGEFIADSRRQFAAMDLNRDGVITPAVLETYRAPYRPSREEEAKARAEERQDAAAQRSFFGPLRSDALLGRDRDDGVDRIDPVMSADVNLRFKVDLDDVLAHAERSFRALDRTGEGRLTRADVQRRCRN